MRHVKREILFKLGNVSAHANPDRIESGWVKYTIHLTGPQLEPSECDIEYIPRLNFFIHSERGKVPSRCADFIYIGKGEWKRRNVQYTSDFSQTGLYKFINPRKIKQQMEGKFYA